MGITDMFKKDGNGHDGDRRVGAKLDYESYRTSISLFEYHRKYLSDESINLSDFIRNKIDEAMEDDGYVID